MNTNAMVPPMVMALLGIAAISVTAMACKAARVASGRRRDERADIHRAVVESMDESFIVAVTDSRGRILYANRAFQTLSGYSEKELLGADHRLLNSGTHPRSFWSEMYRTVAAGETWSAEVCNRAKDGSLYWVDTVVRAVRDEAGRPRRFVAVRVDVTERRRAQAERREAEDRLTAMVDGANVGLWDVRVHARSDGTEVLVARCSGRFAALIGSPRAAESECWLSDLPAAESGRIESEIRRALRSGGGIDLEFWVGDVPRRLRIHGRVLSDAAGRAVLAGGVEDVTPQRKALDALQRANEHLKESARAKADFLANASHELRTPMAYILGSLDLLADSAVLCSEEQREQLREVRRRGEEQLSLIDGILDVCAGERGMLRLEPAPMDLAAMLEELSRQMAPRARAKGLELRTEGTGAGPVMVLADPRRVRAAAMALLDNAVKFAHEGAVTASVALEGRAARLTVRDTGPGIPPERVERLLGALEQGDATATRPAGGLGIGLALARHVVRMSGGELKIESRPGEGTAVTASLPLAMDASTPGPTPLAGVRVLVADDCPDNRKLIAMMLRRAGATVAEVENGQQALAHLGIASERDLAPEAAPDVVVMDMQMPVMDGYDAVRRIRARAVRIPVLALTAHALPSDRERCLSAGCSEYQTKPVDRPKLIGVLRELVLRSRSRGESAA